jgi:NAD-dependent SIR2 family protein deacetylase
MSEALQTLARWIRDAQQVVYLAGAGLSVGSGIRAYRTGPKAIWAEYVLEWGTTEKFFKNPAQWWAKFWLEGHGDLFGKDIRPNPGHHALAALVKRKRGDLLLTQNIDGLSRAAGTPEEQLIEIHGRHDRFICSGLEDGGCDGIEQPVPSIDLSRVKEGVAPKCPRCGSPMRANVLLFDEYYDSHVAFQAHRARKLLNAADVLVFVGTSFSVGITDYALRCADVSGAKVANVNVEKAPLEGRVKVLDVLGPSEQVLPELSKLALASPEPVPS